MLYEGLYPIGTVVLLKESTKRIMIIGVLQKQLNSETERIWEYSGCFYPEGVMGPDKTFLFNGDQIEKVFALGYQDEEQFKFKEQIDQVRDQLLGRQKTEEK